MTEEQVKQIVIDIINEIAPDEDTSNLTIHNLDIILYTIITFFQI